MIRKELDFIPYFFNTLISVSKRCKNKINLYLKNVIKNVIKMFFKMMSGDILELNNQENVSFIEQIGTILQVPHFRIHIEIIDESNAIIFIKDHPHKIQQFYGGIIEGFLNGIHDEYEINLLRVFRKNDDVLSETEWIKYDIEYFVNTSHTHFLVKKDIEFRSNIHNEYIVASQSYNKLIDAISNISNISSHQMKSDTFQYLLDEIPNLNASD